ncbi:MAG: hypothetical protein QOH12_3774 [Solirubrobacteraceae bacterium]|nr:hypothetical protein [Solirubrobacteraceae bacterium]
MRARDLMLAVTGAAALGGRAGYGGGRRADRPVSERQCPGRRQRSVGDQRLGWRGVLGPGPVKFVDGYSAPNLTQTSTNLETDDGLIENSTNLLVSCELVIRGPAAGC